MDRIHIDVSKHFRNTWMRKWGWDQFDFRDAIRDAYRVNRVGRNKWEILVKKKGTKKFVVVYEPASEEVLVITGTEG